MVRTKNQDALVRDSFALPDVVVYLCAVADGMGGHLAGDVASRTAVEELSLGVAEAIQGLPPREVLSLAVTRANSKVLHRAQSDPSCSGMGTTLTAALLFPGVAYICHVGDSRAYAYQGGELTRLTNDHSYVEELLRKGELTLDDAENHPKRNILTRALGVHDYLLVDCQEHALGGVEMLLLCTDGLTKLVSDYEIQGIIEAHPDPAEVLRTLLDVALERGAPDNVTVLLISRGGGDICGN